MFPARAIKGFILQFQTFSAARPGLTAGLALAACVLVAQLGFNLWTTDLRLRAQANMTTLLFASLVSTAVLFWAAAQTRRVQPALFPAWLALALAALCNPLAGFITGLETLLGAQQTYPSDADFFALAIYLLFFLSIALLPTRASQRIELIQWLFDAIILVLTSSLIFSNFFITPDLLQNHVSFRARLLSVAYLAGDLVVLWALIMILFRRLQLQAQAPLRWLFGTFLLLLCYDLLGNGQPGGEYGGSKELLLSASMFFLMQAGFQQLHALQAQPPATSNADDNQRWETVRMWMPYLGLAAAYAVLVLGLNIRQALHPLLIAAWVAVVLILTVARQVLVIRENQRLSRQLAQLNFLLEERVQERTTELRRANQEISERERLLAHNALHDALTNLANRALLLDRLDHALQRMRRNPASFYGVLFMDLDGFKVINDSLGHQAGDRLLVRIARRLDACVREIDTVARFGGDEFAILLEEISSPDYLEIVAGRVLSALSAPHEIDGQQISLTTSIGIIAGSPDYKASADVLRDADLAMYEAKAQGRSRAVFFTPEMRANILKRLAMEKDLARALEQDQLFLQYEPILDLRSGRLVGFEALVRWMHPHLGLISPGSFIPIAEANGGIVPLTYWTIAQALRQALSWRAAFPDYSSLSISVNLSARMFSQPDLVTRVEGLLQQANAPAQLLILEITESALIDETDKALQALRALRRLGFRIHLDDFGTGYSSLSYLNLQFPVDALKVAQSFVSRIQADGENATVVRTIVNLAHQFDMTVIAEGIETSEQMEFIRGLGCEFGQGYYISRSMHPSVAEQFIRDHSN